MRAKTFVIMAVLLVASMCGVFVVVSMVLPPDSSGTARFVSPLTKVSPATIVGEGTWTVGIEIVPGTYRTTGALNSSVIMCYWHTTSALGEEDIMDQGVIDQIDAPGLVKLVDGQYFKTSGCRDWSRV